MDGNRCFDRHQYLEAIEMYTLMERKSECINELTKNFKKPEPFIPKLSFNAHNKFPCMADVLEIKLNKTFGRHIVATADIDVGKTIIVEECFVTLADKAYQNGCFTCLATCGNFIACPKCTSAVYCDESCQEKDELHRKYCGEVINRLSIQMRFVAKSILIALNLFANAVEMMQFVEHALARRNQIPEATTDAKSKYATFLHCKGVRNDCLIVDFVYKVFASLLNIRSVGKMFNCQKTQRFLMHLVGEHYLLLSTKMYGGTIFYSPSSSLSLGLMVSMFNHSCAPNVFHSNSGDKDVFIVIRPVKKGDQLFIQYIQEDLQKSERHVVLKDHFNLKCTCDKCDSQIEVTDRLAMRSDPCYNQFEIKTAKNGSSNIDVVIENCEQFLRKYGRLPWSPELNTALNVY
ncbi:SET and MYND domain-containing protein, partial [Pseudolycoriella hygida]